MKIRIMNNKKLQDDDITDRVIRVKAIMVNSNEEILLGSAFGTIQFPGGHVENNETLEEALKREVKEETGVMLDGSFKPFLALKHYLKDFPVVGNNRSIEIYYFKIETNQKYNFVNMNLDDQERNGNFKLDYVPLKNIKKVLKKSIPDNEINKIVVKEMLIALKEFKKL